MTQRLPLVLNKSLGPAAIRVSNRASVLEAIRRNKGISRAELAHVTDLTQPAISAIVSELLAMGFIYESGIISSAGGRPRVQLAIKADAYFVIGVDLARSGIRASVIDLSGVSRHSLRVDSTLSNPIDITIAQLLDLLDQLLDEFGADRARITGIGVGSPGPLSARDGIILSPPNFVGWSDVPLQCILQKRFRLPVWIDNDANACALAEAWFGGGLALEQFVYVAVGTGVGAGIVINGALNRGAHDMAGELGHTTVDIGGERCSCGNYGCLELYTSSGAVVNAALTQLEQGTPSLIDTLATRSNQDITIYTIAQAAREQDPLAMQLIGQIVRYLSAGVVNAVNLYDPEVVFLGREVIQACGDLVIDPLRAIVAERAFSVSAERVQILASTLGQDGPVLGAACLVLHELFSRPQKMTQELQSP